MESQQKRLLIVLSELIVVLRSDGESHWSDWMIKAKNMIENGDARGLDHLLGAYGGMGSFNDLILGQQFIGNKIQWKVGADKMNDRLDSLREETYEIASDLKRALK